MQKSLKTTALEHYRDKSIADLQVFWVAPVLLVTFLLLAPLWLWTSARNQFVSEVTYRGWLPIINAMGISRYCSAPVLVRDCSLKT